MKKIIILLGCELLVILAIYLGIVLFVDKLGVASGIHFYLMFTGMIISILISASMKNMVARVVFAVLFIVLNFYAFLFACWRVGMQAI